MSKFIDEIIENLCVTDKRGRVSFIADYSKLTAIKNKLNSLGENASRMLEIGIVMDDLATLGFKHEVRSSEFNIIEIDCFQLLLPKSHSRYWIEVRFAKDYAYLSQTDERFFFTVGNWQQDLLSKVKKLIRD